MHMTVSIAVMQATFVFSYVGEFQVTISYSFL